MGMWRMDLDLGRFLSVVVPADVEAMARSYGFGDQEEIPINGAVRAVRLSLGNRYVIVPRDRELVDADFRLTEAVSTLARVRGVSPTVVLWELLPDTERGALAAYLIPQGPGRDNTRRCRSCGKPTNITFANACLACADLPGGPRCRHCEQPIRKPIGDCGCKEI